MSLRPFRRYFELLARYLRPQWLTTLLMSLLLLASIALQLINPKILGYFIDTTIKQGLSQGLIWAALLFLAISLLNQALSVASAYLCEKVAWTATNALRGDLLAHVLTLDQGFHKSHTQGELLERIDGDVNDLSNFFSKFVVHMLFHILLLVSMLVVLTTIDWILSVSMGLYCLLVVVALTWMRRPTVDRWVIARQASSEFFGFLGESLDAAEDVRGNGGINYIWRHFYQRFYRWYSTTCHAGWSGATPWIISQALFTLGKVIGLVLAAYLWSIGIASPGTVYLIFVYSALLMEPLDQIQWQLQSLYQSESCIRRIDGLFKTSSAIQDGPGTTALAPGALAVAFEDVSFGYTNDEPVLQQVSFKLEAGRVLGIVGRSGGGKTTLSRLLFRMYDPQSGRVCVNNVSLTELRMRDLRRRMSLITQDIQLFQASVRDNLTFFDRSISDQRILEVLADVGLQSWYQTLPEQLDTMLGAGNYGLSAGEAQLLAFARVFLTQPDLVMLDEASSRLDPVTEQYIEKAVDTLFQRRTGIVIAHRLATLQRADDILVIENGRILEAGPRIELAANPNSHFAHLLQHESGRIPV
ncbi:ABC transporter ATP-binding protein [Dictyobacter formicarum]|uniref:Helicase n=1 Tax=Dictyobacter formicarum TaxID=2778368 RepID=A0ABQ3VNY4_9CHLR|nr:ABC transporter ATP-binding protein [Dictyobacter formicarum]GHO87394.1 helicase [Dictyobacter formicarum]